MESNSLFHGILKFLATYQFQCTITCCFIVFHIPNKDTKTMQVKRSFSRRPCKAKEKISRGTKPNEPTQCEIADETLLRRYDSSVFCGQDVHTVVCTLLRPDHSPTLTILNLNPHSLPPPPFPLPSSFPSVSLLPSPPSFPLHLSTPPPPPPPLLCLFLPFPQSPEVWVALTVVMNNSNYIFVPPPFFFFFFEITVRSI